MLLWLTLPSVSSSTSNGSASIVAGPPRSCGSFAAECQRQIANFYFVAIAQLLRRLNRLAVDERAVAALQIFNEILAVHQRNLRMLPADGALIEHDVALGMPPQNRALLRQRKPLSGAVAIKKFQQGHNDAETAPIDRRLKRKTVANILPPTGSREPKRFQWRRFYEARASSVNRQRRLCTVIA